MYRNRPGTDAEQRFLEIEKEFGLSNLKDIPIETEFPEAGPNETSIHLVENGGSFYLVILAKETRYRVELTEF